MEEGQEAEKQSNGVHSTEGGNLIEREGIITYERLRRKAPSLTNGDHIKFQRDVGRLFLQGNSNSEIARRLECGYEMVASTVRVLREELKELSSQVLQDQIVKTMARLDLVQAEAWKHIEGGAEASKLLNVVLKAEELEAKVTGALTEKKEIKGQIEHKLYNFKDAYPSQVIDVTPAESSQAIPVAVSPQPSPPPTEDKDLLDGLPDEAFPAIESLQVYQQSRLAARPPSKKLAKGEKGMVLEDGGILILDNDDA